MKFLQKPEGVEDYLFTKAKKLRQIEEEIIKEFELWGYNEVVVPMIEYAKTYIESHKNYRLFQFSDEKGHTLSIRPDFTPSIARLTSTYFTSDKYFPLRVCYVGPVFRITTPKKGERKEYFQGGVELIGEKTPACDAEMVALACEGLKAIGLEDFIVCIGHVGFIDTLLQELKLETITQDKIKEVLNRRNLVEYEEIVESLSLDDKSRGILKELPEFHGSREKLQLLMDRFSDSKLCESLKELEEIFSIVEGYGLIENLSFDLSLLRRPGYYTGFIMEGYSSKTGFPLCGGGRYDELMKSYGRDLPATGFAFFLDKLLDILVYEPESYRTTAVFLSYEKNFKKEAIDYAKNLRSKGTPVTMDSEPTEIETAREKVKNLEADELHFATGEEVIIEKNRKEGSSLEG